MVLNTHKEWMLYKEKKTGHITDKSAGLQLNKLSLLITGSSLPRFLLLEGQALALVLVQFTMHGMVVRERGPMWEHAVSLSRFPADANKHNSPSDTLTF